MREQARFPRSILGQGFPEGFVAGMVEEESSIPGIIEALRSRGLEGDVRVLPGARAAEIDATHHPSLASAEPCRGEVEASQELLAAAFLGDVLLGLAAGSEERAQEIAEVLAREGVRCVFHFGQTSVTVPRERVGSAV